MDLTPSEHGRRASEGRWSRPGATVRARQARLARVDDVLCSSRAMVTVNGKAIKRSRIIAGLTTGRILRSDELVHHKNGNIRDDRHENLEIVTRGQHNGSAYHIRGWATATSSQRSQWARDSWKDPEIRQRRLVALRARGTR